MKTFSIRTLLLICVIVAVALAITTQEVDVNLASDWPPANVEKGYPGNLHKGAFPSDRFGPECTYDHFDSENRCIIVQMSFLEWMKLERDCDYTLIVAEGLSAPIVRLR